MKEMRVCQLGDTDVWRVEQLNPPRWFAFWLQPRWHVVYRQTLFFDFVPAEYGSRDEAVAAMEKFQRWDREQTARQRADWRCGVAK